MMSELKPCPFCGGTNWRATNDEFTCVTCNDCGTIITFDFRFIEETNLNARPIEDALQERISELEAAAMELLNSIPHSELEIARECIGNTNFSVITNCKHKLVRALRKDVNDDRA